MDFVTPRGADVPGVDLAGNRESGTPAPARNPSAHMPYVHVAYGPVSSAVDVPPPNGADEGVGVCVNLDGSSNIQTSTHPHHVLLLVGPRSSSSAVLLQLLMRALARAQQHGFPMGGRADSLCHPERDAAARGVGPSTMGTASSVIRTSRRGGRQGGNVDAAGRDVAISKPVAPDCWAPARGRLAGIHVFHATDMVAPGTARGPRGEG